MRKLIHSKFELDLSPFKISDTEENNWFSDSFFTKYSFPFGVDLTDDLDVALTSFHFTILIHKRIMNCYTFTTTK
jgi:hypothetical protein